MPTSRTPLDICIATGDIVGPIRNGGIGSAYFCLARALVEGGHRVTILYVLGAHTEGEPIEHWVEHYAKLGITLVPLPPAQGPRLDGHPILRCSYEVFQWFKTHDFDVVHFHEWRGPGFCTLLGKSQGLCLKKAVVCVGAHSPTPWSQEGMNLLVTSTDELETAHFEKVSIELADVVWSPSKHMVEWIRSWNWKLPQDVFIKPYVIHETGDHTADTSVRDVRVNELVLFGRLEARKGLDVFCHALDRLCRAGVTGFRVTFLGKLATVGGIGSTEYIEERATKWNFEWKIVSNLDRDGAGAYLRQPGRLAVMPSRVDNFPYTVLECLAAGVAFVASNIGGIPEMIRPEDAEHVLFAMQPSALAHCLQRALEKGIRVARLPFDPKQNRAEWSELHYEMVAKHTAARRARGDLERQPRVSVCITHHNRPAMLELALKSIRAQDYPNIEVVVSDDSDQPEALAYLERLAPEFKKLGWIVVHHDDRFVGAARNAAVRAAHGEYVMLMDDDNVAMPHEVSTFVRALNHSGADVIGCFLQPFRGMAWPQPGEYLPVWPFLGAAFAAGIFRNAVGDSNAMMKRSVFLDLGGYTEEEYLGYDDWEFMAKAVVKGYRVQVVPEALVWYRIHDAAMKHRHNHIPEHVRALRPYMAWAPAELRGVIQYAKHRYLQGDTVQAVVAERPVPPRSVDNVRKVVIFGSAGGGAHTLRLVKRCGWEVPYFVDNNQAVWGHKSHGIDVKPPTHLRVHDFDLIFVATTGGKQAVFDQLSAMGFSHGTDYMFFLDPMILGGVQIQLLLT